MQIRIRDGFNGEWIEPHGWFEEFHALPEALEHFQSNFGPLKRVLITSPSPALAGLAAAIGASRKALVSGEDVGRLQDFDSLEVGSLVKISFPWVEAEDGWESATAEELNDLTTLGDTGIRKRLTRKVDVGRVEDLKIAKDIAHVTMAISGDRRRVALHLRLLKKGEISIASVPEGTPQGEVTQTIALVDGAMDRWKYFMSQNSPQFAFFGDGNLMKSINGFEYFEDDLCQVLLGGVKSLPMSLAARLDQLSNDREVHFVNSYDRISEFPKTGSDGFRSIELMRGLVLVGNRAIDLISKKTSIASKLQIAILDTGRSFMQDQALQSFAASASYFDQIDDFALKLGWNSPLGTRVWGWN